MQNSLFDTLSERKFRQFHAKNPKVYTNLVRLAREARANGKRKVGIELLWNVMRWEMWLQTSDEDFKLNNNYKAFYARLIMGNEADLIGIFNLRSKRT